MHYYRLLSSEVAGVRFDGVTLEGSCRTVEGEYRVGRTPTTAASDQLAREPYTCERLTQIRGGYRALTPSCTALHFDFSNPKVISNA